MCIKYPWEWRMRSRQWRLRTQYSYNLFDFISIITFFKTSSLSLSEVKRVTWRVPDVEQEPVRVIWFLSFLCSILYCLSFFDLHVWYHQILYLVFSVSWSANENILFNSPFAIVNFILSSTFVMITFEYTMPDIKLILYEIDTEI